MDALTLAKKEAPKDLAFAQDALIELRKLEISTQEDHEFAAEVLQEVKQKTKALEEKRKKITGPLNTALKEVNELFRPVKTALEEGEKILKEKIVAYVEERDARNDKALEAAAVAETSEEAEEALAEVEETEAAPGVSIRYVWKFEIRAPDMVPYEFLCPDVEKISEHVKQSQGEPEAISGVRFFKKAITTSRKVKK